jgi:hypothetical protein
MVMVEGKDQAVVQATRLGGGGSMWGEATRSQKQKHVGSVVILKFVHGKKSTNINFTLLQKT